MAPCYPVIRILSEKMFYFIWENVLEIYSIFLPTLPKCVKTLLGYIYSNYKALLIWNKTFNGLITVEGTGSLFLTYYP